MLYSIAGKYLAAVRYKFMVTGKKGPTLLGISEEFYDYAR